MKAIFKVMLALMLAVVLTAGAWAEEADQAATVEITAAAEACIDVTVTESELNAGTNTVYVLMPYDEKDTVLTDPAKLQQVKLAVVFIADTLKGSDSALYIGLTSAADAQAMVQIDLTASPEEWCMAVEGLLAAEKQSNRLDSRLMNIVPKLLETADSNTSIVVLGDGILDVTSSYQGNNIAEKLAVTGANFMYRSIAIVDQANAANTETCILTYAGEGANYAELATENAAVEIAGDLFEAIGVPAEFAVCQNVAAAEVMNGVVVIDEVGNIGSILPSEGTATIAGRVKNFTVKAEGIGEVAESGKAINVNIANEYEDLAVTFMLDGNEVVLNEEGAIPGELITDGSHTISVKAMSSELAKEIPGNELIFVADAAPALIEGTELTHEAFAASDFNGEFVFEGVVLNDVFTGAVNFTAVSDSDVISASVNAEGRIVLSGTPEAGQTAVTVTVTAYDENGFGGTVDFNLNYVYFPCLIAESVLVPETGLNEDYQAGAEISAKFTLDNAELIKACLEYGWEFNVVYVMGEGEPVELEGSIDEGWQLTETAAEDAEEINVYLTMDGSIETAEPAWTADDFVVFNESELIENIIGGVALVNDVQESYELNANVSVNVTASDEDLALVIGAHDYADHEFALAISGEGVELTENGYTLHGEPITVTGSLEEGWVVEMPAHSTSNFAVELVATSGEKTVEGMENALGVVVEPVDILRKVACMVDGKEVWEEPNMMKLYIVAGGAVVLIIVIIIVIINLTRKKFKGYLVMEVITDSDRVYDGKPIDLSVWEKKAVSFGTLLSGSGLPPIAALTTPAIMNKLTFKPVKNGIRVTNKTGILNGGEKVHVLFTNQSLTFTNADKSMSLKLTYNLSAIEGVDNMGNY